MIPERRRVAILGGTFDPVHNAHLAMLLGARDALDAAEGWLLPAPRPNLRGDTAASPSDRRDMLTAAAAGLPRVRVVDLELRRGGPTFTIDTLDDLSRRYPELETWWVVGADAVRRIGEWHRSEDLRSRARFAVVQRAGAPRIDESELRSLGLDEARTRLLPLTPPDIAARDVRSRLAAGESVAGLVPPPVARLIAERGLYAAPAAVHNLGG